MTNKKVSKEDFVEYLKNYPNRLSITITRISDPPIKHYHDNLFDKEVASIVLDWLGENGEIYRDNTGIYWEYYIKK